MFDTSNDDQLAIVSKTSESTMSTASGCGCRKKALNFQDIQKNQELQSGLKTTSCCKVKVAEKEKAPQRSCCRSKHSR